MAAELGKAYVQIIPKAEGISGNIENELGGGMKSAGLLAGNNLVGALTGVIAAAKIGEFLGDSIATGMNFDKSMSQVAATMGMSMEELATQVGSASTAYGEFTGNLREYAQFMGSNTAFSASQAADALNYMALAGYDVQTSMDMLPNVLNLAAAGSMELAAASDMITDASSALGLSLDETSLMVDKMAKAASKSNTSVAQLGEAILTVGGTAKDLTGGTTELAQVLGIMADNGIKGSEAGTHLRNIMLSMTPKSEAAAKAMEMLGLNAYDSMGNLRPLGDVFQDLAASMEGMSTEERNNVLKNIFNKTDLAAVNALLATSGERWDQLASDIDAAWYTVKTMDEELKNVGLSTSGMQTNLEKLGVSADVFQSAFDSSAGSAEMLAEDLWEAADAGVSYDDIVNALGGDLGVLQTAFDATTGAAQAMADTQLDNLEGDVTLFKSALEGVQIALSDAITPALREIVSMGSELMSSLTAAITEGDFSGFEEIGRKAVELFKNAVIGTPDRYQAGFELVTGFLNSITEKFPEILSKGIAMASEIITGIVSKIPDLIRSASTMIQTLLEFIIANAPTLLEGGVELLMNVVHGILDNLPEIIRATVELIQTLLTTIVEHLPEILQMGIELVGELIAGLISCLPDLVAGALQLVQGLWDAFLSVNWADLGWQLIQGVINGIKNAAGNLAQAAMDAAKGAFDAACDFLGINSPARKGIYIGEMLDAGFAEGITQSSDLVDKAVNDLASTATSDLMVATKGADFDVNTSSNSKIDVLISLLSAYLPEIAENKGVSVDDLYNGFNRQLGWAIS